MGLVAMQKVAILSHSSVREEVISALHDEGVIEISMSEGGVQFDHTDVNFRIADVTFAISVLKDFADKQTLAVTGKKAEVEDVLHATKHCDVRGIVDALQGLEAEDTDANKKIQELSDLEALLLPWKTMKAPLSNASETESVAVIHGTLPKVNAAKLSDTLTQEMKRSVLEKVSEDDKSAYFVAYIWKEDTEKFENAATSLGWTNIALPTMDKTAAVALEETAVEQKKMRELLETNKSKRAKLSVELPNLIKVRTFMQWLDEKQSVRESMAETESTVTLLGWMPRDSVDELEKKLMKVSTAIAVMKVKPDEGEETPVLLKNPKLIAPFESVTGLYGLPLSHEMDPTTALSPFFILYFALCLTDAGYGAIIALIFGITLLVTKKSIQEAKLIWLLFFGGLMTFFVSIPFGGWFGLTPEQVPEILTKQTEAGLYFKGQIWNLNQQSGVDFLQNLSLILGVTHLFFGMYLAGQHKWLHGKKVEALWVDFTSHLLLGAILFFAFAPEGMKDIAQYTLYGSIAILIWGKGYGSKWFVRPLIGLIGLLNFVIGMISNGLSYLRILALGLVTGAIASAINQVAVEMGKLFPTWLAIPVIIGIFLVGHLVSIALNTLGSFIHSGRLQFIEFFSQFFEGGGRGFSPFKRTT